MQVTFNDLHPETKYTVYVVEDKVIDPKGKLVISDEIKDTSILQVCCVDNIAEKLLAGNNPLMYL